VNFRYRARAVIAAGRAAAALAAGLFAAGACGLARSEAADAQARASAPAPVAVAPVRPGELTDTWTYVGEVRPLLAADLAAGAAGEVREVLVREGDRVAQGQLLVRIDPSLARARLGAAAADVQRSDIEYEQARREQERASQLGHVLSPSEIEAERTRAAALESRAQSHRAVVREVRASLDRHRVSAPFDGVVAARRVDPGDWVEPGDPVLALVGDDRIEILVRAAPALAPHVDAGHVARIRGDDGETEARVSGVVRALDPSTRTITVRLTPDQPPAWLLPGAVVDVDFTVERRGRGVVVPRDALVPGAVRTRVVRVVDGRAESVAVEVLATAGADALIEAEGLGEGDTVVVRGNERLRPGQAVAIEP
jgi:RND family efflux transporter MFP subunit